MSGVGNPEGPGDRRRHIEGARAGRKKTQSEEHARRASGRKQALMGPFTLELERDNHEVARTTAIESRQVCSSLGRRRETSGRLQMCRSGPNVEEKPPAQGRELLAQ